MEKDKIMEIPKPDNPCIEYALLVWWKCNHIELPGNEVWKHYRDYKALVILFKKWMDYLKQGNDWDKTTYDLSTEYLDYTASAYKEDWNKIEDIRIAAHSYLGGLDEKDKYCPTGAILEIAPEWGMRRIRELTNS